MTKNLKSRGSCLNFHKLDKFRGFFLLLKKSNGQKQFALRERRCDGRKRHLVQENTPLVTGRLLDFPLCVTSGELLDGKCRLQFPVQEIWSGKIIKAHLHLPCMMAECQSPVVARFSILPSPCGMRQLQASRLLQSRFSRLRRATSMADVHTARANWIGLDVKELLSIASSLEGSCATNTNIDLSLEQVGAAAAASLDVNCSAGVLEITQIGVPPRPTSDGMFPMQLLTGLESRHLREVVTRSVEGSTSRHRRSTDEWRICDVHNFTIDFLGIPKWKSFFIAPKYGRINLCAGSCANPHLLHRVPLNRVSPSCKCREGEKECVYVCVCVCVCVCVSVS